MLINEFCKSETKKIRKKHKREEVGKINFIVYNLCADCSIEKPRSVVEFADLKNSVCYGSFSVNLTFEFPDCHVYVPINSHSCVCSMAFSHTWTKSQS